MSEQEVKPGDIVKLKSCSQKMTVAGPVSRSHQVLCKWFNDGSELQQSWIHVAALEVVKAPQDKRGL